MCVDLPTHPDSGPKLSTPIPKMSQSNYASIVSMMSDEERIEELAKAITAIHGRPRPSRESSGFHLAIPCPLCLQEYGAREMKSKHLQINADKLLGLGRFKNMFISGARDQIKKKGYAQCMKDAKHGSFTIDQILGYPTLEERGYQGYRPEIKITGNQDRYLIPDYKGNLIPDHPGKITPITQLPHAHPALDFLRYRDYDPVKLVQQFRAAWCYEEAPEGEQYRRWYRKHDEGWKSTPQGRIIFFSDVAKVQSCWQGRYLEIKHEGQTLVWHPYRERWEHRPNWPKGEEPVKYNTAPGSLRNSQLCGFDHVVACASLLPRKQRVCVLTEGPLDAARFPEKGMAVLGKNLSDVQAILIKLHFDKVVLAFDADEYGAAACEKAARTLDHYSIQHVNFFSPEEQQSPDKMDVGELGYLNCEERLKQLSLHFD